VGESTDPAGTIKVLLLGGNPGRPRSPTNWRRGRGPGDRRVLATEALGEQADQATGRQGYRSHQQPLSSPTVGKSGDSRQIRFQRDRVVVLGVMRAVEQGRVPRSMRLDDGRPGIRPGIELGGIALAEFLPAGGIVAKPATERRAWRSIFQPGIEDECILTDAARPESLHQEASAVPLIDRFIHAFERDHLVLLSQRRAVGRSSAGWSRGEGRQSFGR